MAIKTTGPISIIDVVNEFGGTVPHSLSEYYRGGDRVPNASINNNVPTSGPISVSNFYGATRFFTTNISVPSFNTDTFAQTCIGQNTPGDVQPAVTGSYQKYYFRTFQGFNVQATGTQITIPPTSVTIRGDLAGGKSGDNQQTGIRNPGLEIAYRASRFSPATIVGSLRGSGQSTDDVSGFPTISVPGGTITCNALGFYTIRRVADVFSTFISTAPINIFNSGGFTVSAFGVAEFASSTGEGWG
jgi:hypothetical protein